MPGKKRKQLPLMLSPFETEALEVFARRLRRARLRRNLTQTAVAEREVIAVDIDAELIDEDLGRQRSRPKYKPADF
jgi:hypothetical protein